MSPASQQLLEDMTSQERAEVEALRPLSLSGGHREQPQLVTDDISVQELTERGRLRHVLSWLNAEEEDIYSLEDGEAVQWPSTKSNAECGADPLPVHGLSGAKVRPRLCYPDDLLPRLEDVLCLFISSAMPEELLPTDFMLEPGHASFLKTG